MSLDVLPPETAAGPTNRFHLSLNVADLGRSVEFFTRLFGQPAAKHRADYAKFELTDPPVVLSLEPHAPARGGALNHLGFRFPDAGALVAAQRRLEEAGIRCGREEGVECCYARQSKFWVHDPDGNLWEFYVLEGDLDHRGAGQSEEAIGLTPPAVTRDRREWSHLLGQPLDLPAGETFDAIKLRGSFNVPLGADATRTFLADAFHALRPGGELTAHILTGDSPLPSGRPQLPGPAAYVSHVPVREELLRALAEAGFVHVRLETFRPAACFTQEGVELRETLITARRPDSSRAGTVRVAYRGPLAAVVDDLGNSYPRGVIVQVPAATWALLEDSPVAEQFTHLACPSGEGAACTQSVHELAAARLETH